VAAFLCASAGAQEQSEDDLDALLSGESEQMSDTSFPSGGPNRANSAPADDQQSADILETIPVEPRGRSEPEPGVGRPTAGRQIEEIVVSAQRKAESLQDVPIAINAFTEKGLERAGVDSTDDLTYVTPGLQFNVTLGNVQVFLRGVGSVSAAPGNEPSIATYVDDIYYASTAGALTSTDNIERIEVLKGPQGTLYGRNATGGLIHLITPEPQEEGLLKLKLGYQSYDTWLGSLYASGGLSDRLKASISAKVHDQNRGYGRNQYRDTEVQFVEYQNARAKVVWEPTDSDRFVLAGDYYNDTSDAGLASTTFPGTYSVGVSSYPGSPYDTTVSDNIAKRTTASGGSLKWEHSFGDGLVFKSISAYREVYFASTDFDLDGGSLGLLVADFTKTEDTLQQEFLLQGAYGAFEFSAGVFYLTYQSDYPHRVVAATDLILPNLPLNLLNLPIDLPLQPGVAGVEAVTRNAFPKTESYAAYGQVDFAFTDKDTLTLGARYTIDEQSFKAQETFAGVLPFEVEGEERFAEPTWRLALKHAFSIDHMVYGGVNRGFKSGGYNASAGASSGVNSIDPELLDAYDIGYKGTLLDGLMQISANAYYYDYQNLQVTLFQGISARSINAAKAEIYGAEVEGLLMVPVPVGDLMLNLNYGYLSSEYVEFKQCEVVTPLPFPVGGNLVNNNGDCSGNQLMNSPEHEMTLGASYSMPVGFLDGTVGFGATYYRSSGYFYLPDNARKQPAFNMVSAEVWYAFRQDKARVRAFGSNLTDELVWGSVVRSLFDTQGRARPPRTYGISLEFTWE
jgi:iron complex outermembrane receptor protein